MLSGCEEQEDLTNNLTQPSQALLQVLVVSRPE